MTRRRNRGARRVSNPPIRRDIGVVAIRIMATSADSQARITSRAAFAGSPASKLTAAKHSANGSTAAEPRNIPARRKASHPHRTNK